MAMLKIYILTFRYRTTLKIQMCKSCKQKIVCMSVSQPGGFLVAVAAVTTAFLQGEADGGKSPTKFHL